MRCNEIGFGTGDCAYNIMLPWRCKFPWEPESERKPKYVSIDKCLLPELLSLWEQGIHTTGCCCGHAKLPPFISVRESDILRMESLGYEHGLNHCRPEDKSTFLPKTKLSYEEIRKGFNWWDDG